MQETLYTARLTVRPIELSDANPTVSIMTPAVSCWTASWPEHVSYDDVAQRIQDLDAQTMLGLTVAYGVQRTSDGFLMVWMVASKKDKDSRVATLGYWIGEAFQRNGYTIEAVSAFIPVTWVILDIDMIEAGTQPGNAPSISILQRLGMLYTGDREELAPARNRFELCRWYALDRPPPDFLQNCGLARREK